MARYETRLFIDGDYVDPVTGKTFPLHNPATGEFIADIPIATQKDVDRAVEAAKKAQPAWAATPAYLRARALRKLADLIYEHSATLQELDSICMGKPLKQAAGDVEESRNITNYFSGLVELAYGQTSTNSADYLNISLRQPYGVVAAIVPWNFPTMMASHEIGPACGAGNALILKTSEKSPLSGAFMARLCREAGFPAGVVNIISGPGDTGALLSSHMQIRKISFTGSTRAGRAIMQAAARSNLKDVALELGGKSPLIVFDDADLEHAATLAVGSITINAGQVCTASSRLFVHRNVAASFADLLRQRMSMIKLGSPADASTDMGPLADKTQAAAVSRYLEIGKADGRAIIGGNKAEDIGPNFVQPTVFADVPDTSELNVEEAFGPILILHEFDSETEVIARANDTEYGLFASVFTREINKALRVARALDAGSVGVNTTSPYGAYELPFGGFKGSGIGRQKGANALLAWTQEKTVYVNHAG